MLTALFAISTCTKGYNITKVLANEAILREDKWAREKEDKRLSISKPRKLWWWYKKYYKRSQNSNYNWC